PDEQYARWHRVVGRITAAAVQILTWLDEQDRAARLSFADIAARLAALPPSHAAHISGKVDVVERFIVVHGQVILNQIDRYYKEAVRRCGFVKALKTKLGERRHRKLAAAGRGFRGKQAKAGGKLVVVNPMKNRQARKGGRPVPMPATTTQQVRRIWSEFFATTAQPEEGQQAGEGAGEGAAVACGTGAYGNGEAAGGSGAGGSGSGSAAPVAAAAAASVAGAVKAPRQRKAAMPSRTWALAEPRQTEGRTMYGVATCGDLRLTPGSVIRLGRTAVSGPEEDASEEGSSEGSEGEEDEQEEGAAGAAEEGGGGEGLAVRPMVPRVRGRFGLVQSIFADQGRESAPQVQVRRMVHGHDTVLGDVASASELFLLDLSPRPAVPASRGGPRDGAGAGGGAAGDLGALQCLPLNGRTVAEVAEAQQLSRAADHTTRLANAKADEARLQRDAERASSGLLPLLVYRNVYCPLLGMFRELRLKDLALGEYVQGSPAVTSLAMLPEGAGFTKDGVTYKVGDFMYVRAAAVDSKREEGEAAEKEGEEEAEEKEEKEVRAKGKQPLKAGTKGRGKTKAAAEAGEEAEEETEKEGEGKGTKGAGRQQPQRAGAAKGRAKTKALAVVEEEDEDEVEEVSEVEEPEEEEEEVVEKAAAKKRTSTKRTTHKGSSAGLRAWQVVQLVGVVAGPGPAKGKASSSGAAANAAAAALPATLQVRRFYRPEDVSADVAYNSGWWDLYAPAAAPAAAAAAAGGSSSGAYGSGGAPAAVELAVAEVYGKCKAVVGRPLPKKPLVDTFVVVGSFNPLQPSKTGPPPQTLALPQAPAATASAAGGAAANGRKAGPKQAAAKAQAPSSGTGGGEDAEDEEEEEGELDLLKLPTMDIFAGCGGLSEGMHQAGVADTRWAIEYDREAADAFKLNNPEATVLCNNCNVLLRAAMVKAGCLADCCSDPAADAAAEALDEASREGLPAPGAVGLMMGGPPCQGYSGMNRFNKGNWSQIQNS
ncbi:DNA (cytosine-5)-methyltransferase 1, partial [Tetrabaena socialis]